ncbi:MAG: efflux RND transporter periplasmic adaptor subunit [Limisphaerales bacterium]
MNSRNLWLLAFVLALSTAGCGQKPSGAPGGRGPGGMVTPVVTAEARLQPVSESISLIGSVTANEFVEIKSETDGIVQAIGFEEGKEVTQGQSLVVLDDTKLAATLAESEANAQLSEATHTRSKDLFTDKLISQQEFDQASATFARNRATLELTRRQLKDARIVAPFAGVAGARQISPGQVITRSTVLTTLVDLDPVKIEFYVPERFLSQVATGQTIDITVAAYPGRTFSGLVFFIAPQLDFATRKALVKARIENAKHELKPGMFASLDLNLTLREQAVVIPEIALMFDGDQARVFVVDANDLATLRPVKVGLRLPGQAEIVSGIEAGEKVVVEGTQKVVPGAKVMSGPPPGAPPTGPGPAPASTNPPAR